jgi:hypothetical protein
MFTGLILFFLIAGDLLINYRIAAKKFAARGCESARVRRTPEREEA